MKKQFFILLAIAIQIVVLTPYPEGIACAMVMAMGVGLNGLAVIGNGDKMPVVDLAFEETPHHKRADSKTRYPALIDRIESPIGMLSVGDIMAEGSLLIYLLGSAARLLAHFA